MAQSLHVRLKPEAASGILSQDVQVVRAPRILKNQPGMMKIESSFDSERSLWAEHKHWLNEVLTSWIKKSVKFSGFSLIFWKRTGQVE